MIVFLQHYDFDQSVMWTSMMVLLVLVVTCSCASGDSLDYIGPNDSRGLGSVLPIPVVKDEFPTPTQTPSPTPSPTPTPPSPPSLTSSDKTMMRWMLIVVGIPIVLFVGKCILSIIKRPVEKIESKNQDGEVAVTVISLTEMKDVD